MTVCQHGNYTVSHCDSCGEVLMVKGESELEAIRNELDKHTAKFPSCQAFYDALPTLEDIRGIAPNCTDGLSSEEFVRRLRDERDADHAPTPDRGELIEKEWQGIPIYNCRVIDRAGVPFDVIDNGRLITREDFNAILTRFANECGAVDADAVWEKLLQDYVLDEESITITKNRLTAAISAAGGGCGLTIELKESK